MSVKHHMKIIATFAFLIGIPGYTIAATDNINWFIGAGLTAGGEDLATVEVEYFGDSNTDEDITSGGLISFTGGIVLQTPNPAFDLQLSIGHHSHDIYAGGDSVSFSRWPLELLAFAKQGQHRFGGGVSYHLSPELDLEDVNREVFEFENAFGGVIEYGYSLNGWGNGGVVFGVRYLFIDYELNKVDNIPVNGDTVDGNHFGFNVNLLF